MTRIGFGRDERIRTFGLCVPNAALYQAELHPDTTEFIPSQGFNVFNLKERGICSSGARNFFRTPVHGIHSVLLILTG